MQSANTKASVRFIKLYMDILRMHRYLPLQMRSLGDEYVKAEFKRHKNAKEEFLNGFYGEWESYLENLKSGEFFGANLSDKQKEALSEAQKLQLNQLHSSIVKRQ